MLFTWVNHLKILVPCTCLSKRITHLFHHLKKTFYSILVSCLGCHYTAVDMSMPAARSGAVMKYVTDGNAKWNDLGDPYDHLVLPYDPNVDPGCPNNDSYDFVCGKERLVQEISSQINPNEPLVVKRLNAFLSFCHNARKTIINMWLVRMCPRWLEGLLHRLTEPYYRFGKLTTGYVLSAMLEHGFSEEEVLAKKKIPEKPEVDLPNTWNRLKGNNANCDGSRLLFMDTACLRPNNFKNDT